MNIDKDKIKIDTNKIFKAAEHKRMIEDDIDMLKDSILTIISNAKAHNGLSQQLSEQLTEIASIVEKHAQFIINTNHKIKMLMQYLEIDYNDVVGKYEPRVK